MFRVIALGGRVAGIGYLAHAIAKRRSYPSDGCLGMAFHFISKTNAARLLDQIGICLANRIDHRLLAPTSAEGWAATAMLTFRRTYIRTGCKLGLG